MIPALSSLWKVFQAVLTALVVADVLPTAWNWVTGNTRKESEQQKRIEDLLLQNKLHGDKALSEAWAAYGKELSQAMERQIRLQTEQALMLERQRASHEQALGRMQTQAQMTGSLASYMGAVAPAAIEAAKSDNLTLAALYGGLPNPVQAFGYGQAQPIRAANQPLFDRILE